MSEPSTLNPQPVEVFNEYAQYYDLLYKDKDYAIEADYVAGLIGRFHPHANSILELGAGTGIHARLLAEKGFSIHGIERSPEMLNRARKLAEIHKQEHLASTLNFSKGDIRTVRLNQSFDAVIALFHVISYQTTNEDVTAAFETARHHLNPGGVFIFDIWYGPAVLTQHPSVRIKRVADEHLKITRIAEPILQHNENLVDVNYHVFISNLGTNETHELNETHRMRYFFKPEIKRIAYQVGMQYRHAEEWISGKAIGCDTWGGCFVLQV